MLQDLSGAGPGPPLKIEVKLANLPLDLGQEENSHAWGFIRPGSAIETDSARVKLVRGGTEGLLVGKGADILFSFFVFPS